jgi:hypothetical protein
MQRYGRVSHSFPFLSASTRLFENCQCTQPSLNKTSPMRRGCQIAAARLVIIQPVLHQLLPRSLLPGHALLWVLPNRRDRVMHQVPQESTRRIEGQEPCGVVYSLCDSFSRSTNQACTPEAWDNSFIVFVRIGDLTIPDTTRRSKNRSEGCYSCDSELDPSSNVVECSAAPASARVRIWE